ncbi:unnamed protein product [Brassicogethes aeneus]|uniref:RRM domain-containing protein n=1 Tax=Brassicogethes aeneus TaxID=1431903 RepID=A0A9P0B1K5_BRAAE|nr:unnamed protein product [Brassicogethes aeneus]
MATGKKGKKTKGKTFALTTFLQQDATGPIPSAPVRKNWADEVEDSYDGSYESRSSKSMANVVLPTAPKASRDYEDISDKVPMEPPYMAYLSNLPYDVDEEEISQFFKNMKISHMNIPKEDRPGEMPKLKGFGYVEFEDRDSLINALVIPDTTIKSRRIRIEVAANSENDKRRGRMNMSGMGRDHSDGGDWRSNPRSDNNDSDRKPYSSRDNRDSGFSREREPREIDNKPGAWREGERPNRDNERSFSRNYESSDRGGRFGDRDRDRDGGDKRGGGGGGFSRNFGDRDNRDRDGGDRRGYGNRRYDDDRNGGFNRNRDDFRRRDDDRDDSRRRDDEPPRERGGDQQPHQRQKLVLAPRSKAVEAATAEPTAVPSASIFGNAKPVDTATKERQIEERLAKQQDKPRENSRDRRNDTDKKPIERSQINRRDNDSPPHDRPSSQNKKHDDERRPPSRDSIRSPPAEEQKSEKPKREEKKDKVDKEMPKFKEPDAPVFAQNNKFAFLQDEENSD